MIYVFIASPINLKLCLSSSINVLISIFSEEELVCLSVGNTTSTSLFFSSVVIFSSSSSSKGLTFCTSWFNEVSSFTSSIFVSILLSVETLFITLLFILLHTVLFVVWLFSDSFLLFSRNSIYFFWTEELSETLFTLLYFTVFIGKSSSSKILFSLGFSDAFWTDLGDSLLITLFAKLKGFRGFIFTVLLWFSTASFLLSPRSKADLTPW